MAKKKNGKKIASGLPAAIAAPETGVSMDLSAKRAYIIAPRVIDSGICCPHCGECYGHHVTNTYPNGNRRHVCGKCNKPFVAMRKKQISA